MPYGYAGKILKIDLSTKKIEIDKPDDKFYRSYMGGSNIGAYYLLKEMRPGIDPLGPDNILVIATSIVTGIPSPGFSRYSISAKSPLTGCFGESQSGGYFGAELKFTTFDAVVIKGRAKSPCYIYIEDGKIDIREAKDLWGTDIKETQDKIRSHHKDKKIRVLSIGKGGENMVRYACVISDLNHVNGRTGMGAVFGSKNLKAIAVRGKTKVNIKDNDIVKQANKYFRENYKENPVTSELNLLGTAGIVAPFSLLGQLPSYNFRTGTFSKAEEISAEKISETIFYKNEGCYACPVKCKRTVKAEGEYRTDPEYGGPEYETIASFGSNCGVDDLRAIAHANMLCNKYTLDTISTGSSISFAMECYGSKILTEEDTNGLDLKFGNTSAMIEMIHSIANREGLGDLLAEGVRIASEKIGKGSKKFAMHVKGQELPYHDPRVKGMLGFSYAFSPIGADHVVAEHDGDFDFSAPEYMLEQVKSLGLLERAETSSIDEKKVRMFTYLQNHFSFMDCLCLCVFTFAPVRVFKMKHLVDIVSAVTGWETSLWEIMKIGEKRINMAKCFNIREGIGKEYDTLPDRMFEHLESGPNKGIKMKRDEFEKAQRLYYRMRNWNLDSVPTKAKLYELDLGWIIDDLEEYEIKLDL